MAQTFEEIRIYIILLALNYQMITNNVSKRMRLFSLTVPISHVTAPIVPSSFSSVLFFFYVEIGIPCDVGFP